MFDFCVLDYVCVKSVYPDYEVISQ